MDLHRDCLSALIKKARNRLILGFSHIFNTPKWIYICNLPDEVYYFPIKFWSSVFEQRQDGE